MLTSEALKNVLHRGPLTQQQKLLLCLAVEADSPKSVSEVRRIVIAAGLRSAEKWNISRALGRSDGKAIRTAAGWELGPRGRELVAQLAGTEASGAAPPVVSTLRSHLAAMKDPSTREFVAEAIACFEARHHRAAVVLSWVGAVAALKAHVVSTKLAAFNAEAKRRNAKWKDAKNADDIGRMKESQFLDCIEAISIIGKNVKQELGGCLTLRNGCGHPNSLKIAEHRVSSHLEVLILNVFSHF